MSKLEINKYNNLRYLGDIPDNTWTQVDNNATSLATLLIVMDNLKTGESILITKKE